MKNSYYGSSYYKNNNYNNNYYSNKVYSNYDSYYNADYDNSYYNKGQYTYEYDNNTNYKKNETYNNYDYNDTYKDNKSINNFNNFNKIGDAGFFKSSKYEAPKDDTKSVSNSISDLDNKKKKPNTSYKYWDDQPVSKKYFMELVSLIFILNFQLKKDDLGDENIKQCQSVYQNTNNDNSNNYEVNKYKEKQENNFYEKSNNNYDRNRKVAQNDKNEFKTKEEMLKYYSDIQKLIYRSEVFVMTRYPQLLHLNAKNKDLLTKIKDSDVFYVVKSFSEEDIHKGIKYNLWTSSITGNETLENAYTYAKQNSGSVYLYFSANGSGRFVGIAKMTSTLKQNKKFPFWSQDNKWDGFFRVEWLFIKDIPFKVVKPITFMMKDGIEKSIIFCRDVQEVPSVEAKKLLNAFLEYPHTATILEHFEFYDLRQENYTKENKVEFNAFDLE